MDGHNSLDLGQLASIVSLPSRETSVSEPELRTSSMPLNMDVRRHASIVHAEADP
jgi:hypothetical protein